MTSRLRGLIPEEIGDLVTAGYGSPLVGREQFGEEGRIVAGMRTARREAGTYPS